MICTVRDIVVVMCVVFFLFLTPASQFCCSDAPPLHHCYVTSVTVPHAPYAFHLKLRQTALESQSFPAATAPRCRFAIVCVGVCHHGRFVSAIAS